MRSSLLRLFFLFTAICTSSAAMAQADNVPLPKARPVTSSSTPATPATAQSPATEDTAPSSGDATEPPARPAEDTDQAAPNSPDVPLPRARPDPEPPQTPEPKPTPSPALPSGGTSPVPADQTHGASEPAKPARLYQSACPALLSGQLEGKLLPPISDNQCGAQSPLSITGVMVNGRLVPLSGGVTTSCGVASALPGWIGAIDGYLFAKDNTRVSEVLVGTSYMCRNVNNAKSGNLSFHAFADALDVMGFKLEDGRTVTVEAGWPNALSSEGRMLRFAHDAACAQFTTTLGPEANAEHRDHLHVDMGCHGKTCTARLCE